MMQLGVSVVAAFIWVGLLEVAFPNHTWPQFWAAMGIYIVGYVRGLIQKGEY